MLQEIVNVHTVNGHKYHNVDIEDENGHIIHCFCLVETPNCELQSMDYICTEACTKECRCAQNLFSEIGIDF